eukprot:2670697-Pleurochrysis_carterae.AAC.2
MTCMHKLRPLSGVCSACVGAGRGRGGFARQASRARGEASARDGGSRLAGGGQGRGEGARDDGRKGERGEACKLEWIWRRRCANLTESRGGARI